VLRVHEASYPRAHVRLRIIRQPVGSIDGIRLDDFTVDFVYDVSTLLGCYLLADGCAEPVADTFQGRVSPMQQTQFHVLAPPPTARKPQTPGSTDDALPRPPRSLRQS
jgi:hypothetical protein